MMKDIYKIKDLEQIKLLSDPLKLQLIQAFSEGEKTIKQVALDLDVKITKLYRHVDALYDAGLIVITEEKQKRGTVERTFRAIAHRFEADHTLFNMTDKSEGVGTAQKMLRVCEDEILTALQEEEQDDTSEPIVMRLRGKVTPQRLEELKQSLKEWMEAAQDDEITTDENLIEFGSLIAFYPIK